MNEFDKESIIEKITQAQQIIEQKLLIDDIIDIYNGDYLSYRGYQSVYKARTEVAETNNTKQWDNSTKGEIIFKFYPRPILLNEEIFEYIRNKGNAERENK